MVVFLTLLCAALSVLWIASPLLGSRDEAAAGVQSSISEAKRKWTAQREVVFSQLEELEESFMGKKISSAEYEKEKQRLVKVATDCLNSLEELEGSR